MITRRNVLASGAAALASAAVFDRLAHAVTTEPAAATSPTTRPENERAYTPVITPNGSTLEWKMDNGVKVFHLIAEPVKREFAPGMMVNCWGYNGQTPGPTIETIEGDRVRILVTNKLPEPTTVHWHGVILPNGMDGVAGLTQPAIAPGQTFVYEFTLRQHGTQMYHPHYDEMTQMALGMQGFFIIHPSPRNARPAETRIDRDYCIFLQEWAVPPGAATPNPNVMTDFNLFTFNSKIWPGTALLLAQLGQRVRIRFANLSMDNHPIHLHGHRFFVTATAAGEIQPSAWWPESTVDVPVGTTRDIEFVADNAGDWPLHCHKNHHAMNAMSHDVPNMIGVDQSGVTRKIHRLLPGYMAMGSEGTGDMADMQMDIPANTVPMMTGQGPFGAIGMGGMFTVFKVRERINGEEEPGWYQHPDGTVAHAVG